MKELKEQRLSLLMIMKIKLLFSLILFILVSCKTSSQHEINIPNLQESFIAENETQFLNQFPKDFNQFHSYFGWNSTKDEPEELYHECNDYIDYWFDLLDNEKYKEHEKNIIGICTNGKWEPDAVNYFQDKSLDYIKKKRRYDLINKLKDSEAKSILFFLFDSPHPQMDADFISNLSTSKKSIVNELFESTFSDHHADVSQPDPEPVRNTNNAEVSVVETYSFDINKDGVLDKINVLQEHAVLDNFDSQHFGLTLEILKGEGDRLIAWRENNCIFSSQNNCISEGFDRIILNEGGFTIVQQSCYDYSILVDSRAKYTIIDDEIYLVEYREDYFNKQNHEQKIPAKTWTEVDFGRVKFENMSEDFFLNLRK